MSDKDLETIRLVDLEALHSSMALGRRFIECKAEVLALLESHISHPSSELCLYIAEFKVDYLKHVERNKL